MNNPINKVNIIETIDGLGQRIYTVKALCNGKVHTEKSFGSDAFGNKVNAFEAAYECGEALLKIYATELYEKGRRPHMWDADGTDWKRATNDELVEYLDEQAKANESNHVEMRMPSAFPVAWLYAATAGIVTVCVLVALYGFK